MLQEQMHKTVIANGQFLVSLRKVTFGLGSLEPLKLCSEIRLRITNVFYMIYK